MTDQPLPANTNPLSDEPAIETKATPFQMVLGVVFLVVCVVICGNVFGLFGDGGKPRSIGVTRDAIVRQFSNAGFGFQPAADYRDFASVEATAPDGITRIRLVGPQEGLVYAAAIVDAGKATTPEQQQLYSVIMTALVTHAVPEWSGNEAAAWLTESMQKVSPTGLREIEKRTEHAVVRFTVATPPFVVTVSVESKDW